MKELEGTGCYCVHYMEKWEDGEEHFEQLQIVCQELKNGPVASRILGNKVCSHHKAKYPISSPRLKGNRGD